VVVGTAVVVGAADVVVAFALVVVVAFGLVVVGAAVVVVALGSMPMLSSVAPTSGTQFPICVPADEHESTRMGRKRSSAVDPTSAMARSRSFTPGICTKMLSPWREISGSATPSESMRLRMICIAWLRVSELVGVVGLSTTDTPPLRSRPSWGRCPAMSEPLTARMVTVRKPISRVRCLFRIYLPSEVDSVDSTTLRSTAVLDTCSSIPGATSR
jgi:hypothetical protein